MASRIAIIGTGYVGLTTGACFAHIGHDVVCADIDPNRIERLRQGILPIYEPGLQEIVEAEIASGRLRFVVGAADAAKDCEFAYLCVQTPQGEDGAADLTYLHVFPYSPRPGTPAARMPQVDRGVGKARAKLLRDAGDRQFAKFCRARVGALESVLVETGGIGRTEQFVPVEVAGYSPGEIVPVRIVGVTETGLVGEAQRSAA